MRILKMITAATVLMMATQGFAITKEACNNKSGVGIRAKTTYQSAEAPKEKKSKGQTANGAS